MARQGRARQRLGALVGGYLSKAAGSHEKRDMEAVGKAVSSLITPPPGARAGPAPSLPPVPSSSLMLPLTRMLRTSLTGTRLSLPLSTTAHRGGSSEGHRFTRDQSRRRRRATEQWNSVTTRPEGQGVGQGGRKEQGRGAEANHVM